MVTDSARANCEQTSESASKPSVGQRCVVLGCPEPLADDFFCAPHRRQADESLQVRCVFDDGHALVADGDRIACAEHRVEIDREMAVLIERTSRPETMEVAA